MSFLVFGMSDQYSSRRGARGTDSLDSGMNQASNRVRDLKAQILSDRSSSTEAVPVPFETTASVIPSNSLDIRLRPPPLTSSGLSQRRAGIISQATRIELSTNSGIQSKLDLNEDRSLSALFRLTLQLLASDTVGDLASVQTLRESIHHYVCRELHSASCQFESMRSLSASIDSLADGIQRQVLSTDDMSQFRRPVEEARRKRARKDEYNLLSGEIQSRACKDISSAAVAGLHQNLEALEAANNRLIRQCELRRRQVLEIDKWVGSLETGVI